MDARIFGMLDSMSWSNSQPEVLLGPVFRWELIRLSRRGLWHLGRFLFAIALLFYLHSHLGDKALRADKLEKSFVLLSGELDESIVPS